VNCLGPPDPLLLAVPPHDCLMPGAHVLEVEEHLLAPLLGPDLIAGVRGLDRIAPIADFPHASPCR